MKFRLALAVLALLPVAAHSEESDKQSVYAISGTTPLAVSGTSVRMGPLSNQTQQVRIAPKVDAHCKFGGAAVTATVSDSIFFAFAAEYIKVQRTDGNYLACIADSSGGLVFVDEMKP
jgi:enamine deaminase RidA (YjgF/YER057c/UK114 family)